VYEDELGKVEWTSWLGPDKLKLLKNFPDKLADCQPPEIVQSIQEGMLYIEYHNYDLFLRTLIQYMAL